MTLLLIASGAAQNARSGPEIVLPAATTDRPYSYQVPFTQRKGSHVTFEKIGGNAPWLEVSQAGVLNGTPDSTAPSRSVITIRAELEDGSQVTGNFVVPVETFSCPKTSGEVLAWCNTSENVPVESSVPEKAAVNQMKTQSVQLTDFMPPPTLGPNPDKEVVTVSIIQFHRIERRPGKYFGLFGHFNFARNRIDWDAAEDANDANSVASEFVNAVNRSKVPISGSILVVPRAPDCELRDFKVVTESVDSSSILVYGPSEITAFCHPVKSSAGSPEVGIIVLPVHAIWANVFATPANVRDPSWQPLGDVPPGHECNGRMPASGRPSQGIRPCDTIKENSSPATVKNWYENVPFYWPVISGLYTRLTQPGVTQGSITVAPWDFSPKATYDAQAYVSTRLGPGWIGFIAMFEHDIKTQDDLDSLTAAITYDWRFGDNQDFLWSVAPTDPLTTPSPLGVRVPEFNVRFGSEFTPGVPGVASAQRKLNLVAGATVRLPIIFSLPKQPSAFSLMPVVGFEQGERTAPPPVDGAKEPENVSRFVGGVDMSLRQPFDLMRNFLGDKPITLDYSYRVRQLFSGEPYIDMGAHNPAEVLRTGSRAYNRVTLIVPYSAYVQLRIAWQHGTLPPEFQYVGNLVTLGVTFSNPGSIEH